MRRVIPFTLVKSPTTKIFLPSGEAAMLSPCASRLGAQVVSRAPVVMSKARMFERGVSFEPAAEPAGRAEVNEPVA